MAKSLEDKDEAHDPEVQPLAPPAQSWSHRASGTRQNTHPPAGRVQSLGRKPPPRGQGLLKPQHLAQHLAFGTEP